MYIAHLSVYCIPTTIQHIALLTRLWALPLIASVTTTAVLVAQQAEYVFSFKNKKEEKKFQ